MPTTQLPYSIQLDTTQGGGSISSDLMKPGVLWDEQDDDVVMATAQGGADMLESFLLALACEGVDVATPHFAAAIESAVTAFTKQHD